MIGIQGFNSQNNSENKGKFTFNHDVNDASTFDSNITIVGRPPRWEIGDGTLPITGDSISITPTIESNSSYQNLIYNTN